MGRAEPDRPLLPKFSGFVEVEAHYIFHPSTIWVRPLFTELGPKLPPPQKKADFAMKQTNICRLSGDIKTHAKKLQNRAAFQLSYASTSGCNNLLFATIAEYMKKERKIWLIVLVVSAAEVTTAGKQN